jgi:hypothetical protein
VGERLLLVPTPQPRLLLNPPIKLLHKVDRRYFERQFLQRVHNLAEQGQFLATDSTDPEVYLHHLALG